MSTEYHFVFWNLENLFDIKGSPRRSEKLERAIGSDLMGWTQMQLDRKVHQLASIIRQMNSGRGPDLLGVCEVENRYVLDLLVQELASLGRNYAVAHHDMSDARGIDVAFIYDRSLLTAEDQFSHFVMRRTATRDLFQVNFRTPKGRLLVVLGNHWPSRKGDDPRSAGYRAIAGETLAYFHERTVGVKGKQTPVLAMGDFNDEPFDASLVGYALAIRSRTKVMNATSWQFLNLMWLLLGQGMGTYYYDKSPNMFDQFLANKNLLKKTAPIQVLTDTAQIIALPEMVAQGEYPHPIAFGGMGKLINWDGFSDHFPIGVTVLETD